MHWKFPWAAACALALQTTGYVQSVIPSSICSTIHLFIVHLFVHWTHLSSPWVRYGKSWATTCMRFCHANWHTGNNANWYGTNDTWQCQPLWLWAIMALNLAELACVQAAHTNLRSDAVNMTMHCCWHRTRQEYGYRQTNRMGDLYLTARRPKACPRQGLDWWWCKPSGVLVRAHCSLSPSVHCPSRCEPGKQMPEGVSYAVKQKRSNYSICCTHTVII